jgi:hypothetical protein
VKTLSEKETEMSNGITRTNRRGTTYHLCEVPSRNGKTRFVFSREPRGKPVAEIPSGYEVAESVNGQVSLRKAGTSPISEAEVQWVRAALRRYPHLAFYGVEAKKDTIVIYEPQGCVDPAVISSVFGVDLDLRRLARLGISSPRYSPVFRFTLIDPEDRRFSAERMCYRSSLEGWLSMHAAGSLSSLADRFLKHLGKDSLFELF